MTESQKLHDTVFNDPNMSDSDYLAALEKINKVLTDRGIDPIKPPTDDEDEDATPVKEKEK